jgi:hypothetical protein
MFKSSKTLRIIYWQSVTDASKKHIAIISGPSRPRCDLNNAGKKLIILHVA